MMTSLLSEANFKPNVVPIEGWGSHRFNIRYNYKEYINNLWINMNNEIDIRRNEFYKQVNYYDLFDDSEAQSKTTIV
jgi:hypothetical protein